MEALSIALSCIVAAVLYGIVHDQFTARICVAYFTIFHPPIFHTQSPPLLAFGWGVLATWWVGVFLSIPMILAARAGPLPVIRASELRRPIALLLVFMAVCATLFGLTGYVLSRAGVLATDWLTFSSSPSSRYRFMAAWWAHSASYASGLIGGIVICIVTYRRRRKKLPLERYTGHTQRSLF